MPHHSKSNLDIHIKAKYVSNRLYFVPYDMIKILYEIQKVNQCNEPLTCYHMCQF